MVNRYDRPAEAQFINTYVPLPFQQLYTLGKEANARVDKAIADLSSALDKWSDFRSPSEKDTKAWYDETMGKAKPIIDKLAQNIDSLKTPEGRAQINSLINNVDRYKLATLKQSREGMLQRMEMNQKLAAAGKFNEMWHGVDFANYDTLTSRIYNDVSPLAYKDVRELSDPYYAKLQRGYLYTKGGYDYFGNSKEDIEAVADAHYNDIVSTPEAQKHMQLFKQRTGATDEEAQAWFRQQIIDSNIDRTIRPTRELNQYAKMAAEQAYRRQLKAAENAQGSPVQFTTKLAATLMNRPYGPQTSERGNKLTYNSQFDRIQKTFAPDSKYRDIYINRVDENGTQLPLNRNKSAYGIVSRLSTDIGSQANFINDAMLDKSSMVRGLAGTPIYSGNSVYGMMTPEQYINSKFGLSVNEANWNPNRVKFEKDLIAGNIPNVGVTPTNKVLIENGIPGDEQFTQEYKAYVPVQYFIDNGYDFGETDPEKLIKNEDFNKFLSTLNGRLPSPSGDIVKKPNIKFGSDKNAAYREIQSSGWLSDPQYAAAIQYDGIYVEVPVMRQVLNNQQTRERANLEEFQYTKMGSKLNAAYRGDNEELIYGQ